MNRALWMLCGSYHIPNVKACGRLVYTNNPYGSAARGAGPPQQHFALECAMDMLAAKTGIDPLELRRRNSLRPGQGKSSGPPVEQWPFPDLCDAIQPHYERSRRDAAHHQPHLVERDPHRIRRELREHGVVALAGVGDRGGDRDAAVEIELDRDGGHVSSPAHAERARAEPDAASNLPASQGGGTDHTTAAGPAAGSRITFTSHCAPLVHATLGPAPAGAVRFSLGCFNREDEIDAAIAAMSEIARARRR